MRVEIKIEGRVAVADNDLSGLVGFFYCIWWPVSSKYSLPVFSALLVTLLAGCPSVSHRRDPKPVLRLVDFRVLAEQLGLELAPDFSAGDIIVLTGDRGTVVFNRRMPGVLVDGQARFRNHRVVMRGMQVSVPEDFVARCNEMLGPVEAEAEPEPGPKPESVVRFRVVLDPGHGGRDPGAVRRGLGYEKTVNMIVSRLVAARLKARGIEVTLTRTDDRFIELNDRPAVGNRLRADAFVSIHADACERASARGFTVFVVHTKYSDSSRAALVCDEYAPDVDRYNGGRPASRARRLEIIQSLMAGNRFGSRRLAALIRTEMRGVPDSSDRGTQLGALRVLRRSVCPAVLVELGFMSNPAEGRRLFQAAHQARLADAVAAGIVRFLQGGG